jgi:hypothetical protein
MPASDAATKNPVLTGRYEDLKELSSILEKRRLEGHVGSMTVQDLDTFPQQESADPVADHQLYAVYAMTTFGSGILWWQNAMDFALKLHHRNTRLAALRPESSPTVEEEFSEASSKALAAYSEAIAEGIRNDERPLEKTTACVVEYRRFTKCAAGILSRLFPELSHQALLQIP